MTETKVVAESRNYIVLDKYDKIEVSSNTYQSEASLEREFIADLVQQGYEYSPMIKNGSALLANARVQLQKLNEVTFSQSEWARFCVEYFDKPGDNHLDKTAKVHNGHTYDFKFDDGQLKNIHLFDKKIIARNKLQVISQFEAEGEFANRYDVTVLVNGIPLVQIELKRRGVAIREAFNQIHRYSKESFSSESSLFRYLQICVISNGTDSRYFAFNTKRDRNSYDFTMNWANSKNDLIRDLKDFTATFFERNTILSVLLIYSIFDASGNLLIMRPYQIAATERILWKIRSSYEAKSWHTINSGGYIWHTTGSGKTLTSFKAARLATELPFIDKVLFVVDRKDLDTQTMEEYKKFSTDSVSGSANTAKLKENIENNDNKIIVTTIQKLNNLIKSESDLPVYNKQVVFIFDEAHRSQFGEAQSNITKKFKKTYQFGFTGTPIFPENALGAETTMSVFGTELHSYVITDAIRDEKVLKFKVDYNDVRPKFKAIESEQDLKKLSASENKMALLHPERIREISQYILDNFRMKTHRTHLGSKGFNAMFAVSSIDAAKQYYEALHELQKDREKKLTIATIFSFSANEEQCAVGEIEDETFEVSAINSTGKEFLTRAISDYNARFKTSYSVLSKEFENYYKDLGKRMKAGEIDLLIVVGMYLTGFDAPCLNTLFVDKNLRYHGLIQAYSRTNRIFDATKTFGNIITFRDLEKATVDAISIFGDKNTRNVVLEKSYAEYMQGFTDLVTGKASRGYIEVTSELAEKFGSVCDIETDKDKREFVKLFGEYLKVENILQNYDEFDALSKLSKIDMSNDKEVEEFKAVHNLSDENFAEMSAINVPSERELQDYRSAYNDIREWQRVQNHANGEKGNTDWEDIVFEIDLLKSQEINLDYILELIFDKNQTNKNKEVLIQDVRRMIRSSVGNRAKESLIVDFINQTNLDEVPDKAGIIEAFFTYAQNELRREADELIDSEKLNEAPAKRYLKTSLKREFASENGTDLSDAMPKMSRLNKEYIPLKKRIFQKICDFIEKFKGIGGL